MTLQLRQAHRYIWFTLAIGLPALWVAAICQIPAAPWQSPIATPQPPALPVVLQTRENDDWILSLRADSIRLQYQVELMLKKPLQAPNLSLIRRQAGKPAEVMGLLGNRGVWRFPLDRPEGPLELSLEDRIHETMIFSITL